MNQKLASLFQEIRRAHAKLAALGPELDAQIKSCSEPKEHADASYVLREIADYADEIKKKANQHRGLSDRMACVLTIGIGHGGPIKTEYCTATPDLRTIVTIPKQSTDPDGYAKLMQYLNVPSELYEGHDHAAIKPNWPGLVDLIARHQEEGRPLPPGIDPNKTYPEYKLIIRGKKPPLPEAAEPEPAPAEETPF